MRVLCPSHRARLCVLAGRAPMVCRPGEQTPSPIEVVPSACSRPSLVQVRLRLALAVASSPLCCATRPHGERLPPSRILSLLRLPLPMPSPASPPHALLGPLRPSSRPRAASPSLFFTCCRTVVTARSLWRSSSFIARRTCCPSA
jgi:hypothetical protein